MNLFGKKYECRACGTKFRSEAELMTHGRTHMARIQQEEHSTHEHFLCKACGGSFHSEAQLKQHARTHM